MAARKPTAPNTLAPVFRSVESICPADIGRTIRFYEWDADREIAMVTTAELRQINANGNMVSLTYGLLAEREFTFERGEMVVFNPAFDMSDVPELRQQFCDFHGITDTLL